ncbi:nucleolar protein 12 isoform X2 [Labeo rohita]|uniref:nucleolar protein 12 isoform X2 n=1 Tax=Labeo rohita TaxID=84645 RepID=UPI0021E23BC4|nr:nucleolar protein 12 isoform X2 [Labeo rohita]
MAKNGKLKQKSKFTSGVKPRKKQRKCVLMFDDKDRQDFLTGFHKRKVERRKAALEEIKNKLKEEQKRVRDERHKEYLKMLQERRQAMDEADELVDAITGTTESVQYDHPNHTVTVTTISDLDLSATRLLEPDQREEEREEGGGGWWKNTSPSEESWTPPHVQKDPETHFVTEHLHQTEEEQETDAQTGNEAEKASERREVVIVRSEQEATKGKNHRERATQANGPERALSGLTSVRRQSGGGSDYPTDAPLNSQTVHRRCVSTSRV